MAKKKTPSTTFGATAPNNDGSDPAGFNAVAEALEEAKADLGDAWDSLSDSERVIVEQASKAYLRNSLLAAAASGTQEAAKYVSNVEHAKGTLLSVHAIAAERISGALNRSIDKVATRALNVALGAIFAL